MSFSYFFSTDSRAVVFALILLSDTHRSIYAVRITTVGLYFDVDDIVAFAVALFDIMHRVLLNALLRFCLQIRHKISSFPHMKEGISIKLDPVTYGKWGNCQFEAVEDQLDVSRDVVRH